MTDATMPEGLLEFTPLFEPLTIRGVTLPNRLAMAPMTRSFCPGNLPDDAVAGYYERRAGAEVGLIITEAIGTDDPAAVGDTGLGETDLPIFNGAESVAAWRRVVDAVHQKGGTIFPQLWHQGPMRMPGSLPFVDAVAFSPSGHYGDPEKAAGYYIEKAQVLSTQNLPVPTDSQVADVVSSFGRAARQAVEAGFDGLALHGAHGYLIDSFLWGETNHRHDRWGGDAAQRTAFAVEVIKACRRELGESRPLVFRFSQWKQQDFRATLAETPAELEAILAPMADAGVDLFDASVRYFNTPAFAGSNMTLAGWAKKLTGKLSGAVGGIGFNKGMYDTLSNVQTQDSNNLALVVARFNAGEFDLVSVGRALLNDPEWVRKARRGHPLSAFDPESLNRLT
jgi:2,4-dienoyl-CoA reductase-like NADH-dependent reductase (Old Yellow Enzyme family)